MVTNGLHPPFHNILRRVPIQKIDSALVDNEPWVTVLINDRKLYEYVKDNCPVTDYYIHSSLIVPTVDMSEKLYVALLLKFA